jgi:hypothetical protein
MGRWKLDRPLENNKKWSSCITSVADANVDIGLKNRDVCWRRPYLQTWAPPPSPVSSGKDHICCPGLHPPPRVPPLLPPRHPTLSALHVLLRSLPRTAARSLWRHRTGRGGRPSPQTSCPAPNGASVGSRSRGMDASQPAPLTPDCGAPDVSYADGVFDPHFSRYVTVMEGA